VSSLLGASHDVGVMVLFRIILIFLSYNSCSAGTIVITEVLKRLGERRARDVGLKRKRGVTQVEPFT
jgi:hypothetical protein